MNKEQFMKFLEVLTKEQEVTKNILVAKKEMKAKDTEQGYLYQEGIVDGRLELMGSIMTAINIICYNGKVVEAATNDLAD